ncbi:hypothetical protein Acsp05_15080 [Actinokineospora sp. NBRC 105648]|nr:hypothetical protein Acsp05_15080 [Actinokineospora sp. NBRC 105648]
MQLISKGAVVLGFSAVVGLACAVPASADNGWGTVNCDQYPYPGCELGAGTGSQPGGPDRRAQDRVPGNGSAKGNGNPSRGRYEGDTLLDDVNLANCSYERSGYLPPPGAVQHTAYIPPSKGAPTVQSAVYHPAGRQGAARPTAVFAMEPGQEPGAWYIYKCTGPGVGDALYRPPVWMPDGAPPGAAAPLPSPAELAAQARSQLRLPSLTIAANPAGEQLVVLPTWLWMDPAGWQDVSATAAVPGVSVTAVARPTGVSWSMGDGSTVTCTGPGVAFPAGTDPGSSSPQCGHTYRSSSAGQPSQAFAVAATVHWTVTWSGAGQSGAFPDMTTTSTAAFRVAESQALATGGR